MRPVPAHDDSDLGEGGAPLISAALGKVPVDLPPLAALRAATIHPARRLRLYDLGAVAPGYHADIALGDNLERFNVSTTICAGQVVVRRGENCWAAPSQAALDDLRDSLALNRLTPGAFRVAAPVADSMVEFRTIASHTPGTMTEAELVRLAVRDGEPQPAKHEDHCLIAVLARGGKGQFVGLLRGFGLRTGAVATSHAHDSHNLVVIGREQQSMATVANAVIESGGGIAVGVDSDMKTLLPLPVAGVVSAEPLAEVATQFRAIRGVLHDLGVDHPHLLMRLSTYTLPVSSGLCITDRGLVDAAARAHVPHTPEPVFA